MSFDRQRFMRNLNKARQCWGCGFLHIGREVDHNHCDYKGATDWMEKRVNGLTSYPEKCRNKEGEVDYIKQWIEENQFSTGRQMVVSLNNLKQFLIESLQSRPLTDDEIKQLLQQSTTPAQNTGQHPVESAGEVDEEKKKT